jgi:hypothetical protein
MVAVHRDVAAVVADAATPAATTPAATAVPVIASAHPFHIHSITVTLSYCQPGLARTGKTRLVPQASRGRAPRPGIASSALVLALCPFLDAAHHSRWKPT